VPHDILAEACISREHDRQAPVIDPVAKSRLDQLAVVHLECGNLDAVLGIDDPFAPELLDGHCGALWGQALIRHADADVRRVSPLQVLHQLFRAGRANQAERGAASRPRAGEPSAQPEVRDANRMVGVEVGEEERCHRAERHAQLE
jgi:hypothetical protein